LLLCLAGVCWNSVFINLINPEEVEQFSLIYFLWSIGGLLAGFGIAAFPLIINTLYWSPKAKAGRNQATYAGIGNLTPGFALVAIAVA